jgi:hypothetical protein
LLSADAASSDLGRKVILAAHGCACEASQKGDLSDVG